MFAHSGAFSVPPPIHHSMYGFDSRPGHARSSSLRNVPPAKVPVKPKVETRRLRQRTLPVGGEDVLALKTMKIAQEAPEDRREALSGDFLVDRIKELTQLCKAEELRVQQLEGSIKHKLSEYPTVVERMTALDQQAIDLYDSLMATRDIEAVSPSYAGRLSPIGRSDVEDRDAYGGQDGQRITTRLSAAEQLQRLSAHLKVAEKAVDAKESTLRVKEEQLRAAEAILSRDQDIIDELERRIQIKRAEIAARRLRQQHQNIAITCAAVIGSILVCIIAVYMSIKRDSVG